MIVKKRTSCGFKRLFSSSLLVTLLCFLRNLFKLANVFKHHDKGTNWSTLTETLVSENFQCLQKKFENQQIKYDVRSEKKLPTSLCIRQKQPFQ